MLRVKHLKVDDNGDRAVLILDERGLPVDTPCRYLISGLHNSSYKSMENKANSIVQFLRWAEERKINLLDRFRTGSLFNMTERDSLVRYLSLNQKLSGMDGNVLSFSGYVSAQMLNLKINHVKAYLHFLCELALETKRITDPLYVALIPGLERLCKQLDEKKAEPFKKLRVGLTWNEQKILLKVTHPDDSRNPFKGYTRVRNYLSLMVLLLTGVRISELLALRNQHCKLIGDEPYIEVTQNEDDDPRLNKPEVKTVGREIPITKDIAALIDGYIQGDRKHRGRLARRCPPYLLLNTYKKPAPWSYSSFKSMLAVLRQRFPELKDVTAHRLRHTFNENIDLLFEHMTDVERDKMKKTLCGWSGNSKQPENYSKRATMIRAARSLRELQGTVLGDGGRMDDLEDIPW